MLSSFLFLEILDKLILKHAKGFLTWYLFFSPAFIYVLNITR